MDWFLYDNGLRHVRFNVVAIFITSAASAIQTVQPRKILCKVMVVAERIIKYKYVTFKKAP